MAPDELAGQQVPCPACQQPIAIQRPAPPAAVSRPQQQAAKPASGGTVVARCACGKSYQAPASAAGQTLRCPACGGGVLVPAAQSAPQPAPAMPQPGMAPMSNDPFGLGGGYGQPAPAGFGSPYQQPGQQPGFAQPGFQPQGFGQPTFGQPGFGALQYGQPSPYGVPGQGHPGQPYGQPGIGPAGYPNQPHPGMQPGAPGAGPAPAKNEGGKRGLWIGLGVGGGVLALGVVIAVAFAMSGRKPMGVAAATNPAANSVPAVTPTTSPTAPVPTTTPPAAPDSTTASTAIASTAYKPAVTGPEPMPVPSSQNSSANSANSTASVSPPTSIGFGGNSSSGSTNAFANNLPSTNATASSSSPSSADPATSSAAITAPAGPFESSLSKWHQAARAPFTGLRRVGDSEVEQMHFSWMVELLPYLGHRDVYDRFLFNKPLTESVNMTVATKVIPEFLMPGDNRQRWKGYPFENLALTHFAGMSGVEDARNVVAAKLPRSDPRAGVFSYKEIAKASEITDGTSNTIMIVGSGKLANPWAMGGGATIRGAREPYFDGLTGLGTKGANTGSLVVMADGSVRHVNSKVDSKVFRAMCTIHGADSFDLEQSAPRSSMK